MKVNVQDRIDRAEELYNMGYNCSQSVYMTFSDVMGIDEKLAAKIVGSFGGGMGKTKGTCGTVSAIVAVTSMLYDVSDPSVSKVQNYEAVKFMINEFKEQCGSVICLELRGSGSLVTVPKVTCKELVRRSTRIISEYINNNME